MPFVTTRRVPYQKVLEFKPTPKNFFQSFEYFVYLSNSSQGYLVEVLGDGDCVRYALVKTKISFFGFDILWCPGGVLEDPIVEIGDDSEASKYRSLLLIGSFETRQGSSSARLVGAKNTMLVRVDDFISKNNMSKNWLRNQRRAYRFELLVRLASQSDLDDIMLEVENVERFKSINLNLDREFVKSSILCPDCICLIAQDYDSKFLGFRVAYIGDGRAYDLIAVNSHMGKRCYASYFLLSEIIKKVRGKGIEIYDLGGVDKEGNVSVYNFKKGAGGIEVFYESEAIQGLNPFFIKSVALIIQKLKLLRGMIS